MNKIPTLYSNYQELMLDLDIFGKIISVPQRGIQDIKEDLFEEFKMRKPYPTLESDRYSLSALVSSDYHIAYNNELELQYNEELVDLKSSKTDMSESFIFEKPASGIQELFSYQNHIVDNDRALLIEKYSMDTGEEFEGGVAQTEKIFGTVKEDSSLVLSDEEIKDLGVLDDEEDTDEYDEDDYSYEGDSDDEDDFDAEDGSDDEEDDYNYDDSDEEDTDEYDEDDYNYEDDSDDEDDFDEEGDYSYNDEDDSNSDDEDDFDDEDDYSYDEDDSDNEDDYSYSSESSTEGNKYTENSFVDSVFDDIDFEDDFEEEKVIDKAVATPVTPIEVQPKIEVKEEVDRSSEPTDIRQFLRKHPRCEYNFALQYFSKKQINDAIKIGKIVKKGNILKL